MNFKAIEDAINMLMKNLDLTRIDGPNFSVYVVGKIIRVDIKK